MQLHSIRTYIRTYMHACMPTFVHTSHHTTAHHTAPHRITSTDHPYILAWVRTHKMNVRTHNRAHTATFSHTTFIAFASHPRRNIASRLGVKITLTFTVYFCTMQCKHYDTSTHVHTHLKCRPTTPHGVKGHKGTRNFNSSRYAM